MKNKKQRTTTSDFQNNSKLIIPDNPILSEYYLAISQFIRQLNLTETSLSFDDSLVEIINDAAKIARHDSNSPTAATLDANWRLFSNQILFHVQQINQRNQSLKILQCISAIKEIVSYTNEAAPIAQAAKKEHHNTYLLMKKALSHIEQAVSLNDSDRTNIQLRSFKNDLAKGYTKFFQLSQLDRAASLTAMQDCKKNVEQMFRILSGANQLYNLPIEFQNFSRFVNQLKLKYDVKKVPPGTQRSRTPPSRFPKTSFPKYNFSSTITNSPPTSPEPSTIVRKTSDFSLTSRKIKTPKIQSKEPTTPPPHNKAIQTPNIKQQSRSKTPQSKIPSLPLSTIRTNRLSPTGNSARKNPPATENISTENMMSQSARQKSSKLQVPSSLPSSKYRKITPQQSSTSIPININENEQQQEKPTTSTKIPSKRKSDPSSINSALPSPLQNEPQKRRTRGEHSKKPSSPLSSTLSNISQSNKKNINHSQNLSQTQNLNKKKEQQCCNLISTAININRYTADSISSSSENEKDINLNNSFKLPKNQSSFSQDSETDQLVMAVKKAKEEVSQLSPTLEKLQRDLSGGFIFHDESTSQQSPPPPRPEEVASPSSGRHEKSNRRRSTQNDYRENDVEIDIEADDFTPKNNGYNCHREIRSFDSRQCSNVSKYSFSTIKSTYQDFLERLKQFDALVDIGESIEKFNSSVNKIDNNEETDFNIEVELSDIDESIAAMCCNSDSDLKTELTGNKASIKLGRALSSINRKIDESLSNASVSADTILSDYQNIFEMIESMKTLDVSNKNHIDQLFLQVINSCSQPFINAKSTLLNYSKNKSRKKGNNKSRSKKDFKKKENEEEELVNQNQLLEEELQKLSSELINLEENEKYRKANIIEDNEYLLNLDDSEKLNEMTCDDLVRFRNELLIQLTEIKKQHENQISQIKESSEESLRKKSEIRIDLVNISKKITDIHQLLLTCGKNRTIEYQSKVISKENLQEILMNLIAQENQIVQSICNS
ncbi:hypothetical protein M9Y10_013302 [Tritrichomonas musculus]|uniref:Uncharacterized protein n=1 Tax=Tritrichomonas musculus TaxID=1915356 RepID=A0ABR2I708_9EUKA